jgi:glyoxylase-like metal-dependent hydrolase (beta-lactamase superfamily II)
VIFQQFRAGGCLSYLLACERSHAAALVDPEISLLERYLGEASSSGLGLKYLIDTHTHADHFSATHPGAAPVASVGHAPRHGHPFTWICAWTTERSSWSGTCDSA